MDEVSIFKHQNCFFLTENQFDDVDEDQQEFAKLMKIIFWPLVMDLKKWLLGYRVSRGSNIEKVILTGGTSRITNIDNFFSQNLNLPVEVLKFHDIPTLESMGLTLEQQSSYQMAQTLAFSTFAKPLPINFLSGEYASSFKDHIPLHSTVFISIRVLLVCLFILIGVLLEWNLLVNEEASLDRIISSSLRKNKSLRMKKSQKRQFKKNPQSTHRLLLRKKKNIEREIKSLEVASLIDAISPLSNLSLKVSKNKKVDLYSFRSKNGKANAFFKTSSSGKLKDLEALEKTLMNSNLKDKNIRLNKRKGQLNLDFKFN
ncbi:MAG: cell division protein FtsA, partial [Bdellovibrionota bacterium]|nr:cell division protein FtsA [Bdellovibrionota bacterium]